MNYSKGVINSCVKVVPIIFSIVELGEMLNILWEGLKIKLNKVASLDVYVRKDFYYGIARLSEHAFLQKRKNIGGKLLT